MFYLDRNFLNSIGLMIIFKAEQLRYTILYICVMHACIAPAPAPAPAQAPRWNQNLDVRIINYF